MSALALATDVDVGSILLNVVGKGFAGSTLDVSSSVVDGQITRSLEGAPTLTLTLEDDKRLLLRSGLFDRQIDLSFDDVFWRSMQVSKQGDQLAVTFEDRTVALLRMISTPKKAARTEMTRAEFALSIVREVKPPARFVCPELHMVQPIAASTTASGAPITDSSGRVTDKQRAAGLGPGLNMAATLYVRGTRGTTLATKEQKQNAERVLDVCASLGASQTATLAVLEAVQIESGILNLNYGDADSLGILQVRQSTADGMGIDNRDIEQCVNAFLTRGFWGKGSAITLAAKNPSWTPGQVAQYTQGSAYPARYDVAEPEARAFLAAYTGRTSDAGSGATPGDASVATFARSGPAPPSIAPRAIVDDSPPPKPTPTPKKTPKPKQVKRDPYQFQRGGTDGTIENSWDCLQRLASEVQWRCYVVDNVVYFVSEATLVGQKPVATLSEDTLGVDGIDFDVDNGKTDSTASITVRAWRQAFPPGSCLVLEDCGPANERWLVSGVDRGLFDAQATLSLKRATDPLPEPADDTTATATGATTAAGVPAGLTGKAAAAYAAAQAISAKRYPYVWGGGHAHCGTPDHGLSSHADSAGTVFVADVGYDCSGSVCAVLAAAGLGYLTGAAADTSGPIAAKWGQAGEGDQLTVWANRDHVFILFHTKKGLEHFGTGDWGKDWSGPGLNPTLHPTAGFTPRHWANL